VAAGAAALAPLLAACSSDSDDPFAAPVAGRVDFANWPLYVDRVRDDNGDVIRPSMVRFTEETGIAVNYREVIPDGETFYGLIQPYLSAGLPTGWDIAVITNGVTLTKMIDLGHVLEIPADRRPNFDANAGPLVTSPTYDPDNRYTMAWQSGITGLAWNPALTGEDITSIEQLFSGDVGKVGFFGDNVDMPNMVMLAAGIEPETSTETDWHAAADFLQRKIDDGAPIGFYKQSYVSALGNGDIAVSMAWSGDIYQVNAIGSPEGLQFAVPSEGGLLWTDNMVIPRGAQHPSDALKLMDFVYRDDIAAMIAEWVNYITPVPAAREVILRDAAAAGGAEQVALETLADSPLVFPPDEQVQALHTYRELKSDQEIDAWNAAFGRFYT
jgi:spermidine/putrescine transport system substrate-binding protein